MLYKVLLVFWKRIYSSNCLLEMMNWLVCRIHIMKFFDVANFVSAYSLLYCTVLMQLMITQCFHEKEQPEGSAVKSDWLPLKVHIPSKKMGVIWDELEMDVPIDVGGWGSYQVYTKIIWMFHGHFVIPEEYTFSVIFASRLPAFHLGTIVLAGLGYKHKS